MMKKTKTNKDISPFSKCSVSIFNKLINGITPEDELIDICNSYSNLTGNGKDKKRKDKYPLFYACQYYNYNSLAIILIEKYPDAISSTVWTSYRNPIHVVIDMGRIDILLLVLEHSSSFINECYGPLHHTPLQIIIYREDDDQNFDRYAFIQYLLKNSNVMINAANKRNETALYSACKLHDVHAIELLFERPDIDPSPYTDMQLTAFHVVFHKNDEAAFLGLDDIEMVDYDTNVTYGEIMSTNSLMIIIQMFVKRFPLILNQVVKSASKNVIHFALMNGNYYIIPYLLNIMGSKCINNVNEQRKTLLHLSCEQDCYHKLTRFLLCQPGICINIKDEWGLTPFHCACKYKSINNIQFLINYPGVDINTVDCIDNTILHSAINDAHLHWSFPSILHVDQELLIGLLLGTDTNINMNLKKF
jgi:ankyrin repeat protein